MAARIVNGAGAALLLPALAFLVVFYLLPLGDVLMLSVTEPEPTIVHYLRLTEVPIYLRVLLNTFEIAFMVSVVAVALAYPVAYLLVSAPPRLGAFLLLLVLVPFFTGVLVRNYAWIFMLGNNGVVNSTLREFGLVDRPLRLIYNRFGVVIASVHVLLPYAVMILFNTMRSLDPRLVVAAGTLRAAPFTAFRRVFLPQTWASVGSAFILLFVTAVAFFITPAMLGGPRETMVANLIAQQVSLLNWGFAAALATVLLVACVVMLVLMQRLFGGFAIIAPGVSARARPRAGRGEWRISHVADALLNPLWPALPYTLGAVALVYLALPILIVLPLSLNDAPYLVFPPERMTLRWYVAIFRDAAWMEALWNSMRIGLLVTFFTMVLAIPAALGIVRSRARWVSVGYAFILSPMVLPAIIIAISIFFLLSRIGLNGTALGLAIGHTIGALPIAIVVLVAALNSFDRNLERAAASLRAGPLRTLWRVTLPSLKGASLTAAFFAFLHSFDEIMVTIFVSGINTRTLPKKMWESLQEINPIIPAVSTLLVLLSMLLVLISFFLGSREKKRETAR